MTDVTIPADVAKRHADWLRQRWGTVETRERIEAIADLLDPRPPHTDVEKAVRVAAMLADNEPGWRVVRNVLAVIADEMAKRPTLDRTGWSRDQRAADVAWLRGEQ